MSASAPAPHRVLITGAGGFIGKRLVRRLLEDPAHSSTTFLFADRSLADLGTGDARGRGLERDLADPSAVTEMLRFRPTLVFHLAGVLSGAAEADYSLSRQVNVDASLALLEGLVALDHAPRTIFASSIAVYGTPLPDFVDDNTIPQPTLTYGAHKVVVETMLAQFSRRGWIDGLALRFPGIVARRDADSRQRTAFFNSVFYAAEAGESFTMPVSVDGTSWLVSVPALIDDLMHAAAIPRDALGGQRAFTLPAQVVRMGDLVDQLGVAFPASRGRIGFAPEPDLDAQFARQPPLSTETADTLGFRHDGDLETLVRRAIIDRSGPRT